MQPVDNRGVVLHRSSAVDISTWFSRRFQTLSPDPEPSDRSKVPIEPFGLVLTFPLFQLQLL